MDAARRASRQPVLGDRRLQHHARAVAGLLAPRPDPAGVLVPGRRGAAVLDRQPPRPRANASGRMLAPRRVAQRGADPPRHLPPLAEQPADLLDLRRHAHADRPRLHVPVPARVRLAARAGRGVRRDPGRVLGWPSCSIRCRRPASTTRRSACRPTGRISTRASSRTSTRTRTSSWAFDVWFLNLFPREKPFLFNGGGWSTLSFIPTLATMMLGLWAGRVAESTSRSTRQS